MRATPAVPTPQQFIFKDPVKSLPRGKACLNCRLYKIKCDGLKPVCGSCKRIPRENKCAYNAVLHKKKEPTKKIARELEVPEEIVSGLDLDSRDTAEGTSSSASHSGSDYESGSSRSDHNSLVGSPEPSTSTIAMLLNNFLPFASQFGFFLHPERFRSAALLDAPFGHSSRPAPALLNAVYLWSAHLSPVDALRSNETVFLNRALQQIGVQVPVHSAHIMHTIQAEILLSTYFFRENQPIEAECHLNGAISLVQSAGLHKIRSDGDFSSPGGRLVEPGSFLGPACDAIDESERINGFWTVYCHYRLISLATDNSPKSFGSLHFPCREIDTPWPIEEGYDIHNNDISGHSTIEQFVNDLSPVARPVFDSSSYPKAVVLLHAATRLYHRYTRGFKTDEAFTIFNAECFHFNCLITRFLRSLPPASMRDLFEEHTGSPILLVFTHVLVSCAYIQIRKVFSFSGFPNAFQDCVSAAQNIIHLLGDMNQLGLPHLCPIMGTFCTMACRVFGDELNNYNSSPALAATSDSRIDANILREYLEAGMSLMSIFAMDNPLMKFQMRKLRSSYPF